MGVEIVKFGWSSWRYGAVKHAWRANSFNPIYILSACGYTAHNTALIDRKTDRKCGNCLRSIKTPLDNDA